MKEKTAKTVNMDGGAVCVLVGEGVWEDKMSEDLLKSKKKESVMLRDRQRV